MKTELFFDLKHPQDVDEKYHMFNMSNIGNVLYWNDLFQKVREIPGTIVECGIGRGRSLITLTTLNELHEQHEGGQRKIWGFDSFEGFDEPSEFDQSSRNPKKGEWSCSPSGKYKYEPDFIYQVLENAGISDVRKKIHLEKGMLKDSLPRYDGGKIALLNIDCDLYEPYKDALDILYDQVAIGGIIVFDDFMFDESPGEPFPGARKAVYEFFNDKTVLERNIKGKAYYIKPQDTIRIAK